MTIELIISIVVPVVSAIGTVILLLLAQARKEAKAETRASYRAEALAENTQAIKTLTEKLTTHKEDFAGHRAEVGARLEAMDREIRDLKGGSGCHHAQGRRG